jgi:membrane associated rhomboid family serine protease
MSENPVNPLEQILRLCDGAKPNPWYPSLFAKTTGISRESLDPPLDQLRMGGLIQLTDWVQGNGQGYILTPAGSQVLESPRYLDKLRKGELPAIGSRLTGVEDLRTKESTAWGRGEAVREALLGRDGTPVVTNALIIINILVFFAGMALTMQSNVPLGNYLSGGNGTGELRKIQDQIGFLSGAAVYLNHQWWRLLTCCFGHVGWVHLLVNMYSLYAVGPLLERMWGKGRFLILYLLAGFGGSCGMLLENPVGGGAGASGALWGILASMATWLYLNRRFLPSSLIAVWTRQLLICFVLNVFITFSISYISKGGHFGGGVVGLIAAVPLDRIRFGRRATRWLAATALVIIPVICGTLVVYSFQFTGLVIRQNKVIAETREFSQQNAGRDFGNLDDEILQELKELSSELKNCIDLSNHSNTIWWNRSLEREKNSNTETIKKTSDIYDAAIRTARVLRRD